METLIWEGQEEFENFVQVVKKMGYKYVILCDVRKLEDENLGAACINHSELVDMLIQFSDMRFFCKVERVDVIDDLN